MFGFNFLYSNGEWFLAALPLSSEDTISNRLTIFGGLLVSSSDWNIYWTRFSDKLDWTKDRKENS